MYCFEYIERMKGLTFLRTSKLMTSCAIPLSRRAPSRALAAVTWPAPADADKTITFLNIVLICDLHWFVDSRQAEDLCLFKLKAAQEFSRAKQNLNCSSACAWNLPN